MQKFAIAQRLVNIHKINHA